VTRARCQSALVSSPVSAAVDCGRLVPGHSLLHRVGAANGWIPHVASVPATDQREGSGQRRSLIPSTGATATFDFPTPPLPVTTTSRLAIVGQPDHLTPEGDPGDIAELTSLRGAVGHRVFAGRLRRGGLGLVERAAIKAVHAPEGDYRDWDAIDAFADEIAAHLAGSDGADERTSGAIRKTPSG
jgi:hypothetical protein